jgi:hypothetical protein
MDFFAFLASRRDIIFIHSYRMLEAEFKACGAIDALEGVISNLFIFGVNMDCICRTDPSTISTQVAFTGIKIELAASLRKGLPQLLPGIAPGGSSGE